MYGKQLLDKKKKKKKKKKKRGILAYLLICITVLKEHISIFMPADD